MRKTYWIGRLLPFKQGKFNEVDCFDVGVAFATVTVHAKSSQPDSQKPNQQTFNEQKYLSDRCRLIIEQVRARFAGQGESSYKIQQMIISVEDYLIRVGTPLAYQMLGDLQNGGYDGFYGWCKKYGI